MFELHVLLDSIDTIVRDCLKDYPQSLNGAEFVENGFVDTTSAYKFVFSQPLDQQCAIEEFDSILSRSIRLLANKNGITIGTELSHSCFYIYKKTN